METANAAPTARECSRRFWLEVKRPIQEFLVLGLLPAIVAPLLQRRMSDVADWKSYLAAAAISYVGFFLAYCLWQLTRVGILILGEQSSELQNLRAFKAQVSASPLYIGPLNYCLRFNGNNVSISLIVLRNAPAKIAHLTVALWGKNGKAFSRDFTNPMQIGNTGQIILDEILLQKEEADRLEADVFQVIGCATLETGVFHNFTFTSIPLR